MALRIAKAFAVKALAVMRPGVRRSQVLPPGTPAA
jgi:hypothetical protein